jgi:hypothetical protein
MEIRKELKSQKCFALSFPSLFELLVSGLVESCKLSFKQVSVLIYVQTTLNEPESPSQSHNNKYAVQSRVFQMRQCVVQ